MLEPYSATFFFLIVFCVLKRYISSLLHREIPKDKETYQKIEKKTQLKSVEFNYNKFNESLFLL